MRAQCRLGRCQFDRIKIKIVTKIIIPKLILFAYPAKLGQFVARLVGGGLLWWIESVDLGQEVCRVVEEIIVQVPKVFVCRGGVVLILGNYGLSCRCQRLLVLWWRHVQASVEFKEGLVVEVVVSVI